MFTGGYPTELFLTPPKEVFNCSICMYTAREPMRCGDEHIFCKKCIMTWIDKGKHSCPIDRKPLSTKNLSIFRFADEMLGDYCVQCVTTLPKDEFATRKRKRSRKEKAKLKLAKLKKARRQPKCAAELGACKCEWTGKLNSLQSHVSSCPETMAKCAWRDCETTLLRKNLPAHIAVCRHRLEPCEMCGKMRKPSKRNIHKRRCPATPVTCLNPECHLKLQRADVQEHRKACPFEMVPCLHSARLGCTFTALRKDISAHSDDKLLHFDAAVRQVDACRKAMDLMNDRLSALGRLVSTSQNRIAQLERDANW